MVHSTVQIITSCTQYSKRNKMKTFVLVACILVIVHVDKIISTQVFKNHLLECAKALPKIPGRVNVRDVGVIFCATKKVGGIDEKNELIRERILTNCETMISNPVRAERCKNICSTCIDEANEIPGSNFIKTVRAIQCAISRNLIPLFTDKE